METYKQLTTFGLGLMVGLAVGLHWPLPWSLLLFTVGITWFGLYQIMTTE